MLRISETYVSDGVATLYIEGRVIGPWVEEVRRCCDEVLARGFRVILDLGEVSFVDSQGIALLRELMGREVTLVHCSPFLLEELRQVTS